MHASDTGERHPESAADEQEGIMVPHPNTIVTFGELRRQDLIATAARERRAAEVSSPALPWRALAIRAIAVVALFLDVRG